MAEHQRKLGLSELAVEDVEVGAAHPASSDLMRICPGPGCGTAISEALSGSATRSSNMAGRPLRGPAGLLAGSGLAEIFERDLGAAVRRQKGGDGRGDEAIILRREQGLVTIRPEARG